MKKIVVEGCTITYSISNGSVSINGVIVKPSSDASVQKKTAFKDKLIINVISGKVELLSTPTGAASPIGETVGGNIEIEGTSSKTSTDNKSFVLEGDEGSSSFVFSFPQMAGPFPITQSIKVTAKVTDAGQNKVKGE